MEIQINLEEMRTKKLFVATPMYGGNCNGMYTRSLCDLTAMCTKYGIEMRSYFLFNESLITRARNYCADEFLRSGADYMLFIDSDIGFNPQDVIAMMALQAKNPDYDVIAGPYPKKCITWEKILAAVNKGVADNNPNVLEDFVGDFVFNPAIDETEESRTIRLDEPAQVLEAGTGFMMIRRETLLKFKEVYPQYTYRPDHVRTEAFDGSREIHMYFQAEIDPSSKRYLSEDYWFCQLVRKAGMKVWLCPWMHLQHAGTYVFAGKLPALASIGASATADAGLLKSQRASADGGLLKKQRNS
ncbi:Glyco_tranf_GTA_type domain containing protein [uncultured Caudovirales phage]|uniref:Glyco_tranf_GTA_type domain containing protein n=1 Tax=uncultured Caudovirales phage TaxID=2100421 RepID=A0A6J7WVM5_9CAUD|nr:Glyco_tranf_GTA_type domain containing protein [uncultured Caudovirales phage]